MYKNNRENAIDMAISTLLDIWEQIDWSKVTSQRSIGIWDEFASKVKAAAMTTNSYETFVEKLCKKMDVRSLKFKNIDEISNQDKEIKKNILKILRRETQIIVLKLRLNKEIRKERAKRIQEEREKTNNELENKQVYFTEEGMKVNEN